jgi:hypothetical protein
MFFHQRGSLLERGQLPVHFEDVGHFG